MNCPKCGASLPNGATVCKRCQPPVTPTDTPASASKQNPNRNKRLVVLSIVVAAVLIVGIACAVLIVVHNHQKKDYSADQASPQAAIHACYAAIEQQDADRILADTPDAVIEEYAQKGINRDDLLKLVQDYLPTYLKTLEDSCGGSITITADLQTEEQEDITDNYTDASLPVERAYRYPIVIRIQGDAGNREETRTSTAIQVDGNWYSTDITAFLSAANTTASSAK